MKLTEAELAKYNKFTIEEIERDLADTEREIKGLLLQIEGLEMMREPADPNKAKMKRLDIENRNTLADKLRQLVTYRKARAFREIKKRLRSEAPEIVVLCGSTRFMDVFFDEGWRLTLEGKIVLSIGVCKHADDHGGEALGQDCADMLDELHFRKIDLADEVRILNVGGYIGDSTRRELEYARLLNKRISFLETEVEKK